VTRSPPLRRALDWGKLAPLRLQARTVADGVYAGRHRSPRRGGGVEFGGHRSYVPGDDLRWLDHRAFMRHGRLLIREFETETDRALRLVVDASQSMAYRSEQAPGAKLAYAAVLGAALARVALASGDPVAVDWIGGERRRPLPAMGGREAFERLVSAFESVVPGGDLTTDLAAIERSMAPVARHARRGSVIVLLSDLIDLPERALDRFTALSTQGRVLIAVQVLDPIERHFTFDGPIRLRSTEGSRVVETDAATARSRYLEALGKLTGSWKERLAARGGQLVSATSADDPIEVVRSIVAAIRGAGP
jgi:uncharacterized protein (DUF58 family)